MTKILKTNNYLVFVFKGQEPDTSGLPTVATRTQLFEAYIYEF